MRLFVEPICGWGWTELNGQSVDVPRPFELDIFEFKDGPALSVGVGRLDDKCDHPLRGLWIRLSQRHATIDGNYNLVATDVKQSLIETSVNPEIKVIGFATARQI